MLTALLAALRSAFKPKPTRQCVQCGAIEGTVFCDRAILEPGPDVCRFVPLQPCSKCNSTSLCFGDVNEGCPLAVRIRRNAKGCKDKV